MRGLYQEEKLWQVFKDGHQRISFCMQTLKAEHGELGSLWTRQTILSKPQYMSGAFAIADGS